MKVQVKKNPLSYTWVDNQCKSLGICLRSSNIYRWLRHLHINDLYLEIYDFGYVFFLIY